MVLFVNVEGQKANNIYYRYNIPGIGLSTFGLINSRPVFWYHRLDLPYKIPGKCLQFANVTKQIFMRKGVIGERGHFFVWSIPHSKIIYDDWVFWFKSVSVLGHT